MWADFYARADDPYIGTEHLVELSGDEHRVFKITAPPKFGLTPKVLHHLIVNLRDDPAVPKTRPSIEFLPATPLEYLARWIAANEVFGDDVKLTAVIEWADGQVSFAISQPQYHGEPATEREIEAHFEASGWTRFIDSSDHVLFYNYALPSARHRRPAKELLSARRWPVALRRDPVPTRRRTGAVASPLSNVRSRRY